MHLAKQGVCVPAEHIFFSPAPPASLRDEGGTGRAGMALGADLVGSVG